MSTYLLKWVVSKYGYAEATTKRGVKVRAFYGKNATKSMSYAARHGAKIIDHLEQVFKIEYQLPKMDMVTVPLFKYGAMTQFEYECRSLCKHLIKILTAYKIWKITLLFSPSRSRDPQL